MVMYPTYAHPVELEVIARTRNFTDMHPTMQERLQALMEDSAARWVGARGCGHRSNSCSCSCNVTLRIPTEQIIWNGERYSRRPGRPPRPPGRSMHELGLAADMAGDFAWLGKNVGRFGLQTFAEVNNEPWHVQPAELPRGRRQYEQQGSKWGGYPTYAAGSVASSGARYSTPARRVRARIAVRRATPLHRHSPRRWSREPATPARRPEC